jgi:hypothetical protein
VGAACTFTVTQALPAISNNNFMNFILFTLLLGADYAFVVLLLIYPCSLSKRNPLSREIANANFFTPPARTFQTRRTGASTNLHSCQSPTAPAIFQGIIGHLTH